MMKQSDNFIENVIKSLKEYSGFENEYERKFEIQTFKLLVDRFKVESFLDNLVLNEDTYDKYFKKIVKKYDYYQHQYMKTQFENERDDYFNEIDRDLIFESIYDNEDYWDSDYQKSLVVDFLRYFFDKYGLESEFSFGSITKEVYEEYFSNTVKHFSPYKHSVLMGLEDE